MCARAIQNESQLAHDKPLKIAWVKSADKAVEDKEQDKVEESVDRWNKLVLLKEDTSSEVKSRQPPRTERHKFFPSWLSAPALTAGKKAESCAVVSVLVSMEGVTRRQDQAMKW